MIRQRKKWGDFISVGKAESLQAQVWVLTPPFVFLHLRHRKESCVVAFQVFQWQTGHNTKRELGMSNEEIQCNYTWLIASVCKLMQKLPWNERAFRPEKERCLHIKKGYYDIWSTGFLYLSVFCNLIIRSDTWQSIFIIVTTIFISLISRKLTQNSLTPVITICLWGGRTQGPA